MLSFTLHFLIIVMKAWKKEENHTTHPWLSLLWDWFSLFLSLHSTTHKGKDNARFVLLNERESFTPQWNENCWTERKRSEMKRKRESLLFPYVFSSIHFVLSFFQRERMIECDSLEWWGLNGQMLCLCLISLPFTLLMEMEWSKGKRNHRTTQRELCAVVLNFV